MDFERDEISMRYATNKRVTEIMNKTPTFSEAKILLLSVIAVNLAEIADELAELIDDEKRGENK